MKLCKSWLKKSISLLVVLMMMISILAPSFVFASEGTGEIIEENETPMEGLEEENLEETEEPLTSTPIEEMEIKEEESTPSPIDEEKSLEETSEVKAIKEQETVSLFSENSTEDNEEPSTPSLEEALKKTVDYYKANPPQSPSGAWETYVGLWGAGENLNNTPWPEQAWVSTDPDLKANTTSNDYIYYGYSLLALGKDPSTIWGRNLFAELSTQQNDSGLFSTPGKHIFAMLLLDAGEKLGADVGMWNQENKEKALNSLLSQQKSDGTFSPFSKPDYVGWALIVLSQYRDYPRVNASIDKALAYLHSIQDDNGSFPDTGGWGAGENANSQACVIQGLVAVGEDLLSPQSPWIKNGNTALDALLAFQKEDGSFKWSKQSDGAIGMSTKQALVALVDLQSGESTWNRIGKEMYLPSVGEKDVEELIAQINAFPSLSSLSLKDKVQVMGAYNRYLQLPEYYQNQVTNKDILLASREKIVKTENLIQSIEEAIWNLPGDIEDITLEHKEAILAIMKDYESLSPEDREYVQHYAEVLDAKNKIDELEEQKAKEEEKKDQEDQEDTEIPKTEGKNPSPENPKPQDKGEIEESENKSPILAGSDNNQGNTKGNNPKTGDQYLFLPLLLFISSLGTTSYLVFQKKNALSQDRH
ncbi:terpene cyclase/mutase family protein [Irregularibacter muris]|uniref:Terpene cyclase/mutase family protein n=1 Tax=Irregularibacter muris TaxID=1796619 RepID=A0AAE3HFL0_9FIRM|nr:prenyltransferase/squalene oxidase repeat-containing protein [Irregularibacter muris]MCR1898228.1 terpene cyclase/mutase family protein [Irregularibacter muris]